MSLSAITKPAIGNCFLNIFHTILLFILMLIKKKKNFAKLSEYLIENCHDTNYSGNSKEVALKCILVQRNQ